MTVMWVKLKIETRELCREGLLVLTHQCFYIDRPSQEKELWYFHYVAYGLFHVFVVGTVVALEIM